MIKHGSPNYGLQEYFVIRCGYHVAIANTSV